MADSLLDNTPDDSNERSELYNKWKDKPLDEVIKAKVESDLFIKTQNARLDDLRNDYLKLREEATAKASLQDLIARQEQLLANPDKTVTTPTEETKPSTLKPEDIDSLLEQKLTQREKLSKQTENFNFVRAKLKEQFGDKASEVLKQRMDTLGLDQAFTDDLARSHPQVFLKTFGVEETYRQQDTAPPRSSQRQTSFAPTVQKRDWNFYQEMKKTNPRMYLDPKIAIQMHNDAIALGSDFNMPLD
jgi:hypothetical protein